jgi:hypothetical protein
MSEIGKKGPGPLADRAKASPTHGSVPPKPGAPARAGRRSRGMVPRAG